ncbi:Crp/Fnr family transcriptional regulator [Tsuneonella suprasediminis]|uniref:Crp/Fnr family transcriptional regulator n=1 Tax=Tsuneonella suprasediminis TaxID=2306996 RepID=UPI002F939FD9
MGSSRQTRCIECPLQLAQCLRALSPEQVETMQSIKRDERVFDRGDTVFEQGSDGSELFTVLEGVLMRVRTLDDGRRQIVNLMFPGDLVGLQGAFDDPRSHSVEAILPARLCEFHRVDFPTLIRSHPRLGYDIVWMAAKEETELEEHIVSLGQRNARERIANLAVWMVDRAQATGIARRDKSLELPITQTQVAEMLGLSLVHVNRTLQWLRREKLVDWRNGRIAVPDMERTSEFAQFEGRRMQMRPFI